MMKLKDQFKVLNPFLLLLSVVIVIFISCKGNTTEKKILNVKSNHRIKNDVDNEEKYYYDESKIFKEVSFKNNSKKLLAVFLKKEQGVLGESGFQKSIEVLIIDKGNLLDKYSFKNKSLLCDLKLPVEYIRVFEEGVTQNQYLFFAFLDDCDGEEPNKLNINVWNNEKRERKVLDIPVYFENSNRKSEFSKEILSIQFSSKKIQLHIFDIIQKLTNLKLIDNVEDSNSKCLNKDDLSVIREFALNASSNSSSTILIDNNLNNTNYIKNFIKDSNCKKTISITDISNCADEVKCEIYCFFKRSQEELDEGELNEEILHLYFKKKFGVLEIYKIESSGK